MIDPQSGFLVVKMIFVGDVYIYLFKHLSSKFFVVKNLFFRENNEPYKLVQLIQLDPNSFSTSILLAPHIKPISDL